MPVSVFGRNDCRRHEFYETEDHLVLTVFDRGANPEQVSVKFEPRKVRVSYF